MYSKVKRRSVLHLLVNGGAASGGRGEGGRGQQQHQQQPAMVAENSRSGSSLFHSNEKAVRGKEEKEREEKDAAASTDGQPVTAAPQTVRVRARRQRVKKEQKAQPQQVARQATERRQLSDAERSSPSPRPGRRRGRQRKRKRAVSRSESPQSAAEAATAGSRTRRRLSKGAARVKKLHDRKRAAASASSSSRSAAASASTSASEPALAFPTSGLPFFSPLLLSASGAAAESSNSLSPFSSGFESELQRGSAPSLRCYFLCSPASLIARVRFVLHRDGCQQNALARCIDVSPGTLSPLLNGRWAAAKRQTLTKLAVWAARRDVQLTLAVMDRCRAWGCDEEQLALGCALEKEELRRWLRFDSSLGRRTAVDRAVCSFVQRSARHRAAAQPLPASPQRSDAG
jgi:transcriptional regulator with XRE-family HTH domain